MRPKSKLPKSARPPLDAAYLRKKFGWDEEEEIKRAIAVIEDHTMISFERLASLWQQVRYLDRWGVEGSLVECGVWRGGAAGMMALAHKHSSPAPARHLHLFDSFEGLPEPRQEDGEEAVRYAGDRATGALNAIGECVGSVEDSQRLLEREIGYPAELLSYHPGWFQETVPGDALTIGPIALLRLDGDWYESTLVCLDHLYERVVRGGVIVIDDYGHWPGCRRAVDEFNARRKVPVLLCHVDYTARFWVKQE